MYLPNRHPHVPKFKFLFSLLKNIFGMHRIRIHKYPMHTGIKVQLPARYVWGFNFRVHLSIGFYSCSNGRFELSLHACCWYLTQHFYWISGVKLSDASKKLGKKFATGASVVKVFWLIHNKHA